MTAPDKHAPAASPDTLRRLAIAAVIATVILTGIAFWLSYEHLHDVAQRYGLSGSRAWAWPATVDTFIVIGEILILRAALRYLTDRTAIFLAATGSLGSIALNVAGVGGNAAAMTYVVAAVPPVAALLAFGALMRQMQGALSKATVDDSPVPSATDRPVPVVGSSVGSTLSVASAAPRTVDETTRSVATAAAPAVDGSAPSVDTSVGLPDAAAVDGNTVKPSTARRQKPARSGVRKKAPRRSLDEWVPLAGPIFHAEFQRLRRQPTANEFAQAIEAAGHGSVSDTTAKTIRAEILDRADVPALSEEGR